MGTFIPNTKEEQLKMLNEIGYAYDPVCNQFRA